MLYRVEVRLIGADPAVSMAELRTRFEDHGISPTAFDYSSGGPGASLSGSTSIRKAMPSRSPGPSAARRRS